MTSFVNEAQELFSSERIREMFKHFGIEGASLRAPSPRLEEILIKATSVETINREDALFLMNLNREEIVFLVLAASEVRERGKNKTVTFSKNVFVPLTKLCRDHCGYCTFRIEPEEGELFVPPAQVIKAAKEGAHLGCTELLFVTGDKPELAYSVYRNALARLGYKTTAEYLVAMSEAVLKENIFPPRTLGVADSDELSLLKESNASMGLMLKPHTCI